MFSLLPTQVGHVAKLQAILEESSFALDFSSLGSGKTYTGSHIALQLGFKNVVVICPVSVQSKWREMQEKYNVPVQENMSFCGVRSVKNKQPKHGLLHRRDYTVEIEQDSSKRYMDKTDFTPTPKLMQMIDEGLLLIIDEMQHLKNVTSQFAACQALISAIVSNFEDGNRKSRVMLLSGSPIDKHEQVITLFRTLRIMRQPQLCKYNIGNREMELRGIQDIINYCQRVDPAATEYMLQQHNYWRIGEYYMRALSYSLFQTVIKPRCSSAMPPPQLGGSLAKFNAFYRVDDPEDNEKITGAVGALEGAVHFKKDTGDISFGDGTSSLNALTSALVRIETAKTSTFIRAAREHLEKHPSSKVAVMTNYSATLNTMKEALAEYQPLVLEGKTPTHSRKGIIDKFQQADLTYRLLIGNCMVCSTGIDLDDKDGSFPRLALLSPSYSTMTHYQLGHRFCRMDTKSDATVHMVFAKHCHELPVLNALARKGGVMRETTPEQAEAGVVFPGEFPAWEEEDFA